MANPPAVWAILSAKVDAMSRTEPNLIAAVAARPENERVRSAGIRLALPLDR